MLLDLIASLRNDICLNDMNTVDQTDWLPCKLANEQQLSEIRNNEENYA